MSYARFSLYYDRLMGDFDYAGYLAYLHPTPGTKGLDLACGTGAMTVLLSRIGMQMQGIDSSGEMLNVAMASARKQGQIIVFRQEDMRQLTLGSRVDLVTVVCDGFNYISPRDLPVVLKRVAACLTPQGRLVFDVSTPYKLRRVLANNLFFEDYDDLTYYWQNQLNESRQAVRLSLTFFEKQGELYSRFEENQVQYWHTLPQLRRALQAAGLQFVQVVDGTTYGPIHARTKRWIVSAELCQQQGE